MMKKKFVSVLLSFAVFVVIPFSSVATEPVKMGDVNGNDIVTAYDVLMILQHSAQVIELTETQKAVADMDGDGFVTLSDALAVLKCFVQEPTSDSFNGIYYLTEEHQAGVAKDIKHVVIYDGGMSIVQDNTEYVTRFEYCSEDGYYRAKTIRGIVQMRFVVDGEYLHFTTWALIIDSPIWPFGSDEISFTMKLGKRVPFNSAPLMIETRGARDFSIDEIGINWEHPYNTNTVAVEAEIRRGGTDYFVSINEAIYTHTSVLFDMGVNPTIGTNTLRITTIGGAVLHNGEIRIIPDAVGEFSFDITGTNEIPSYPVQSFELIHYPYGSGLNVYRHPDAEQLFFNVYVKVGDEWVFKCEGGFYQWPDSYVSLSTLGITNTPGLHQIRVVSMAFKGEQFMDGMWCTAMPSEPIYVNIYVYEQYLDNRPIIVPMN